MHWASAASLAPLRWNTCGWPQSLVAIQEAWARRRHLSHKWGGVGECSWITLINNFLQWCEVSRSIHTLSSHLITPNIPQVKRWWLFYRAFRLQQLQEISGLGWQHEEQSLQKLCYSHQGHSSQVVLQLCRPRGWDQQVGGRMKEAQPKSCNVLQLLSCYVQS